MGRPLKPLIEANKVVEAALEIIEHHGPDGLNMRRLGDKLGVNPASLYHHFKDKDEILDAVADYVVRSTKTLRQKQTDSWEAAAIHLADTYRSVIMAHPNTTMLVVSRRTGQRPAAVHGQYDSLLQKLCAAGFSPERALLALVSLEMLAAGSAIEEANMGPNTQFAPVDPRKYPTLFKITQGAKLHVRTSFAQMCHLLLMGLKAEQEGMTLPYVSLKGRPKNLRAGKPSPAKKRPSQRSDRAEG